MAKRKSRPGEFKAQVVLEALSGAHPVVRLAAIHDLNPSLIYKWVKEAKIGLPRLFDGKMARGVDDERERQIKLLHEKIGQLMVERDFLVELCGLKASKRLGETSVRPLPAENSNNSQAKG